MTAHSLLSSIGKYIGIFLLAYILLLILLFFRQETMIFFPQTITEERWKQIAEDVRGETISITTPDGLTLRGWFLSGSGTAPRATVLFFGGNATRLDYFAPYLGHLRKEGVNVLLVDYRGYGLSDGSPSADTMRKDSEIIYEAVISRSDVDPGRIYLWGISIGTGVATHLASVRDTAGVILIAPFTSMEDVGREAYPYLPVRTLLRHHFNNLALAPEIVVPALIIHGDADRIQGPAHAEKLASAWGGEHELLILKNRGHNNILQDEEVWEKVVEFVRGL